MTDLLIDVEATVPKWKELQEKHGIFSYESKVKEGADFTACLLGSVAKTLSTDKIMDLLPDLFSTLEMKGWIVDGPTEKEAVISLIHRLQLEGWKEVSL